MRPGQRSGLDPGPALRRRGHHRALVDDRDRLVARGRRPRAPAPGRVRPPDRLGQRRGWPGPGSPCGPAVVAWRPGSRSRTLVGPDRLARTDPHERGDDGQPEPRRRMVRRSAVTLQAANGTTNRATASTRPAQAADDGGRARAAGHLPDRGPQHPAAVQGQPGQQVEDPDEQVGPAAAGRRAVPVSPAGKTRIRP